LRITAAGGKLIESSLSMEQASEEFFRVASCTAVSLAGNIRVSANEIIGLYYLPKAITEFNLQYPEIVVEIDISNQSTGLHKRDADIALRMFRPVQPELVAKRLPDIKLNLVASKEYLAKHGQPNSMQGINQHNLMGYDRNVGLIKSIQKLNFQLTNKDFYFKTDFLPLQIELARKGAGITITHRHLIDQWEELELIRPEIILPNLEFWIVCHRDVKHNRRIRIMMDFLTNYFEKLLF
jgi:DNA-binding transcriptional LysR family regulator